MACCSISGFANPAKEQIVEAICNAKTSQCQKACENYRNDIQETTISLVAMATTSSSVEPAK
ncbi:MAG: hypothetical protein A2887_06020 [Alphaproteobacteria bacterium RIFCSPLOWO2_01_FULL_40_26]|nr:MAG: hypothetical protein A3D15_04330 [Alphaproteobacteria bacterium RIFCSPHIGHO2_02_FULL_40_34]OFW94110.1 MAG: hypothetical protein A2887_06020 [Alphaproteobacteria bacterium RIFCSPLOWO2_01_FULL_40_26]OFX09695.1 MAG: hypothetical protein A3H30_06645 [Alphaproteobacteria bacterium RIFCSPLOWO2_02_FULL_40_19]OFX11375.1 MAG: hypothetical protein A3G22_06220 [Alphaproteobacteria bacterium RIFCSPLOWO2_12_FULL_40_11]